MGTAELFELCYDGYEVMVLFGRLGEDLTDCEVIVVLGKGLGGVRSEVEWIVRMVGMSMAH